MALVVKNPPDSAANIGDTGSSLGREEPLEEGTATHSRILAWRIPCTEELGGLEHVGSRRVGHNLETKQQPPQEKGEKQNLKRILPDPETRVLLSLLCRLSLCVTLCDPTDCSPPGPSVHGTVRARTLEWVAIPFSRESS